MNLAKSLIIFAIVLIPTIGRARDETAPDLEMLEFLGRFETAGGKPVDPLALADVPAQTEKRRAPAVEEKHTRRSKSPHTQEQKGISDEKSR